MKKKLPPASTAADVNFALTGRGNMRAGSGKAQKGTAMATGKQLDFFRELIVDNFAGGGGASTGIELATGRPVDIAINHDPDAILMHKTNHPYTTHYCESVWDVNPAKICGGHPVALMWLSPDCKHFSRAKGGKPVNKNVRGLAWIALRWAATVKPRVIILENVPEFVTWGPLNKDNYPDLKQRGRTFNSFVSALKRHGYEVKWQELRACDYGAPTIRKRFFLIARCDGKPIVFPEPTHGEGLIPYRTAAECIDWSITVKSVFGRKKPLADNTMRRIARGLDKFTLKSDKPFIVPVGYGERKGQAPRVDDISKPLSTIVSTVKQALIAPSLIQYHSETSASEVRGQAVTKPIMTVDASPRYGLTAAHIVKYYSGDNYSAVNQPLGTITTRERHGLVETRFIKYSPDRNFGNWSQIREMLSKYCGYQIADDEILLLEISGESYYIADIGMRMLEPRELYNAQGFPPDYIIDHDYKGNTYPRSKQVARCGNAVPPPFAEALVRANLPELCGVKITTMEQLKEVI